MHIHGITSAAGPPDQALPPWCEHESSDGPLYLHIYIFTIYKSYLPPIISCDFHNSFMKWVEITTLVL